MHSIPFRVSVLSLSVIAACTSGGQSLTGEGGAGGQGGAAAGGGTTGAGGTTSSGGTTASGGVTASGGTTASGGVTASGGSPGSGGTGAAGAGGTPASGGVKASGGSSATGGTAGVGSGGQARGGSGGSGQSGGTTAAGGQGGAGTGGTSVPGSGGRTGFATGGRTGAGGAATGGAAAGGSTSTGTSTVDCSATMPTGGTDHCGQNTQGSAGGLSWSLWCNSLSSSACITTYSTSAFSARWSNNSDFLARIGLEFGGGGKTFDQYGTMTADFAFKKSGSAGGFSYIGIYGWSNNPCVEWYIIDDSWGTMPFNAYNATLKGTVSIDGENYKLFQNKTKGTGGSRCSGVTEWDQFWSIRQRARQCGTITISDHFKAWDTAGLKLGGLLEAKILVETGGGTGSIEFPVATVKKTQ